MNTNYDDEATRYQQTDNEAENRAPEEGQYKDCPDAADEATNYDEDTIVQPIGDEAREDEAHEEAPVRSSEKGAWKRTAAGAASGLLIGSLATVLMGMKPADDVIDNPDNPDGPEPEWTDGEIQVATSVNDDMSFGEAFAAARAEVGPGGCFEWHGGVYGTYTAAEWSNMSPAEQAEWSDHFIWNNIDSSHSDVAHHSTAAHRDITSSEDDIEVVSVNGEATAGTTAQNNAAASADTTQDVNHQDVVVTDPAQNVVAVVEEPQEEIEILGVVHDDETGANIGGMMMGGQEVILIDVDDDLVFDYMAADLNNNGDVDPGEVVDIQDQGLTVDDLGGFSNMADGMANPDGGMDSATDIYEV